MNIFVCSSGTAELKRALCWKAMKVVTGCSTESRTVVPLPPGSQPHAFPRVGSMEHAPVLTVELLVMKVLTPCNANTAVVPSNVTNKWVKDKGWTGSLHSPH